MPVFFEKNIDENTKLAVWHITEPEAFFLEKVPLKREVTHPHKRLQHLAGRYLLQFLFPDFPYKDMVIADSRKPFLPNERYHFSISHCGDYAAAIVSTERRVGIDIEIPGPRVLKIANKFLHEDEFGLLDPVHIDEAQKPIMSEYTFPTVLWSAKEAVFKWWSFGGVDFSEDIRVVAVKFSEIGGTIFATFQRDQTIWDLQLQYHLLFDDLCLVYTV